MRLSLMLAAVAAACATSFAQAQSLAWTRSLATAPGQSSTLGDGRIVARSLALDANGNALAAGTAGGSNRDFLAAKISASGSVVWQRTTGSASSQDDAMSVAVDGAGNPVLVGTSTTGTNSDMRVVKYAGGSGSVLWDRTIDSGGSDAGYFVAIDAQGDVVVAGERSNPAGHIDVWIVKLSGNSGATLWERTSDTGRDDFVADLAVDPSGDPVVLGVSVAASGGNDLRVLKLASSNGTVRWQQSLAFGSSGTAAYSLALDRSGNAFVAGTALAATADARLLKLAASNGSLLWQQTIDSTRDDHAQAVALDAAGNVVLAGHSRTAAGRYVFKVFKYAGASGAFIWEGTFDAGVDGYAYQAAIDPADNVVVVGSTATASGNRDWRMIAFGASNGGVIWHRAYAGAAGGHDDGLAIAADASGVVAAGISVESGGIATMNVLKLAAPASPAPPPAPPAMPGSGTNVALASAGAVATASSNYGAPFSSVAAVNDGQRSAVGWGSGGGWEDGTFNSYPDWVQISFGGTRTIDRVVVYTLRDDYGNPAEPSDATTFSLYGVTDFSVEGWNGTSWVTLGSVSGNNLVKRTVGFAAFTTDRIRISVSRGLYYKSRIVEIEAWGTASADSPSNVALAALGGVATASSNYGAPFSSVAAVNDGDRTGVRWGAGGGWEDATYNSYPDWVQIAFNGTKTVDRVVVYTLRDDYNNPETASDATTFRLYGVSDFTVEAWDGGAWVALGSVTGNTLVKRTVTFAPFTTERIRVSVTRGQYFKSRIVEIEAWGTAAAAASTNVALAALGGSATASSNYGAPFSSVAAVIDGDRTGVRWGSGGGWEDGTFDAYPDWVQVSFTGTTAIDRVVVYTLRDDYNNPQPPGDATTFGSYGIVDFVVEGWSGSAWVPLGSVTGNNLVKRTVTFAPFTTDRIRVSVTRASYFKSRIVEIEAWGIAAGS